MFKNYQFPLGRLVRMDTKRFLPQLCSRPEIISLKYSVGSLDQFPKIKRIKRKTESDFVTIVMISGSPTGCGLFPFLSVPSPLPSH